MQIYLPKDILFDIFIFFFIVQSRESQELKRSDWKNGVKVQAGFGCYMGKDSKHS